MTKLTTESLEKFVNDIKTDGMCDITDHQVALALRQLLAYEQAAEHPAARITWGGSEFSVSNVSEDFLYGGTAVYLAPVLPKQPELVMKHSSVIAEQLDGVISSMDVTDHQRAVISCAIDRLNKNAEILQKKTTALIAPETLDYQSAKELFNYLMNEEETNATVNVWNACRAEMLKAQPVSEPYKLNCWISVADRLPSEFGRYLCYVEEQNDLGKSHYQWNCSWNGDVFSDSSLTGRITHWMPLPEPPAQESE